MKKAFALTIVFISVFALGTLAQGGGAGGPAHAPASVPIDGGIGILLGAGFVIRGRKLFRNLKDE